MTKPTALTAAELTDRIAEQVVWAMHARDRILGDLSDAGYVVRDNLTGQISGLRWTLCLLQGWNPARECEHEGRADRFVRVWHNLPGHCTEPGCGPW